MFNFSISQTALATSQIAIDTVSNNIANANTPGYHRREVMFGAHKDYLMRNQLIGGGVDVLRIRGIRDLVIEQSLTQSIGDTQAMSQRVALERSIESLFSGGPGSLYDQYSNFHNELSRLSSDPSQSSQRSVVLENSKQLASQFQFVGNRLGRLKDAARQQLEDEVKTLNTKMQELADVQQKISASRVQGDPNQLLDQRDMIINEIAEIIDVDRNVLTQDGFGVSIGGSALSLGATPMTISILDRDDGQVSLQINQLGRPIVPRGGKLAALLTHHNETLDGFSSRLDLLAQSLIRNVDQAHAGGVGIGGGFSVLSSNRSVTDVNLPLSEAGLTFPITNGQLWVTVTDANGDVRTSSIDVDPSTQSLTDVAIALSGIPNINAVVDTQNGQLKISSPTGYQFDFTGGLETVPDISGLTGTSIPRFSGEYKGSENGSYEVRFNGTGEIGRTPGLKAEVYDAGGRLVAELDVGEGYEAGLELNLLDGVSIAFAAGTVVDGESTSTPLIANSDSSGILSALGVNSFFSGDSATTIAVNNEILANPNRLAVSRTGEVSDASNLKRIIDLKDQLIVDGKFGFEQFLGGLSSEIGASVKGAQALQDQFQQLQFQFESARDAASGVDINEEMINLSRYQRAYEASLRVISTIDQMYQDVLQILR